MRIGIDFGTSYSAAGAVVDGRLQLVRFGDDHQFRTTVYFPQRIPDVRHFELTPELEREVERIAASTRAEQSRQIERARRLRDAALREPEARRAQALAMVPSPTEQAPERIRQSALQAVRRQWMSSKAREGRQAAGPDLQDALYGEAATDAYIGSGTGHLVVSPKSMLGYRLVGQARDTLLGITTQILRHIRASASAQLGADVRSALLGRPVRFRSSMQDAGDAQALQILTDAAHAAGFDAVDFLQEPAAAAIGYHRQAPTPRRVMVLDIGGGTTDIALARVGGASTAPDILGAWGEPVGGTDVDIELSMRTAMALFGKGVTRTPVHHYYEASAAQDLERQASFRRTAFAHVPAPYGERLQALQQAGQTIRLNRQVEAAKIAMSHLPAAALELDYIEPGLRCAVERSQLDAAAARFLSLLRALMQQAVGDMDLPPEAVYLTGGMSRSPYLRDVVSDVLPGIDVVQGDASLGVVSGLSHAAAQWDGKAR